MLRFPRFLMIRVDGSGGSSTPANNNNNSAAAEAARKAEEARRAAEAARKAAEEAAKKAAQEAAALKAAQDRLDRVSQNPDASPQQHQAAQRSVTSASTRVEEANQNAATLATTAREKMSAANEAARAAGKPPAFTNEAIQALSQRDVFETAAADTTGGTGRIPADVQRRLGLTSEDVAAIKDEAIPHLKAAADSILAGKPGEAIDHLTEAAKAGAGEAAERAILRAAEKLPETGPGGVARQLLSDPAVVSDLVNNPEAHEALQALGRGDLAAGLQGLSELPSVQQNVIRSLQENPQVQNQLAKIGLEPEDLANLGPAIPDVIEAGIEAAKGNYKGAIEALGRAASTPEARAVLAEAITDTAAKLKTTGAEGMARSLLTNSDFVDQLLQSENAGAALKDLAAGRFNEGIQQLASDTPLMEQAVTALAQNADFKKGMQALGLSEDALRNAADALPDVLKAVDAAAKGNTQQAINHLIDAGAKAPEAVAELINTASKKLPEGPARALLSDQKFVESVLSDPDSIAGLKDLAAGKLEDGIRKLAGNEEAASAAVDALSRDPKFKAGMERLGLTADALKEGVDALPDLVDAVAAANRGDYTAAIGHIADAAQKAPEVAAELINNAAKKLPDGPAKALLTDSDFVEKLLANPETAGAIKDLASGKIEDGLRKLAGNEEAAQAAVDALFKDPSFKAGAEKLGLTAESLKEGVDALPDLLDAALAANRGDYQAAIGHIADAAQKAPEVAADLITKASERLPEGPARALLGDRAFVEKLLSNPETAGAIKDFAAGKVEDGLRKLANNPEAAEAAVDALFKDPSFKAGAEKLGITPESLKAGVDALPDLVEAGIAANNGDFQGALGHLADAAVKAPEVVADIVTKAAERLPAGPARALLTDRAFVEKLVGNPETAAAIKDLAAGNVKDGLKKLAGNTEAAEAAVDALYKDPSFKRSMDQLGLTPEAMKQGVDALPDLVDAAAAAGRGDWQAAIGHLADAAVKAPEAVTQAITTAAKKLPEGPARALLTDPTFIEKLVSNPETAEAVKQFAAGNVGEGLRKLANNPEAAQAAVDALYKDPTVKAGLDRLGVTAEQLKEGVAALPSVIDAGIAAANGDFQAAVGHLADAAQQAPELVAAAINKVAERLPAGMARDLLTDPTFVQQLVGDPNTTQAIKDFAAGNLTDGLKNLARSEAAGQAAIDVLAQNPQFKQGIEKLGLTVDALKAGVDALPDLVDAGIKASRGDFTGALTSLVDAAKKAPEVVAQAIGTAADNLPDHGPGGILKSILKDPAAVEALLTDRSLHGGIKKLINGDLSGLGDIGGSPAMDAVVNALSQNADVKAGLEKLGLTVEDLKAGARALPHLIEGVQAMAQGDFQQAFSSLREAAVNMPPSIVEKAIKAGAAHLPDTLPASILKSLLTDDAFVHEVVTNPALKDSFDQAMSGNLTDAVAGLLGNEEFSGAAAQALSRNPDLMRKLEKFGITSAEDLQGAGRALVDLLQAGEKLANGDLGGALSELGEGFGNLPADMKSRLIGKFADAVNLPEGAKDILVAVAGVIGDPTVRENLGDAFKKLKDGDIGGFVSGIAEAGRHLMTNNKETAISLLNAMGRMPGSIGRFFDDPEFNRAIVESGAGAHMFSAVEKMTNGDISGALTEIMNAGGSLLTQEPHFSIAGQDLPIGMQGLENMARLAKNFFDALPASLRNKIMEQAGKAAGKSLIKSIPLIGNVFSGISAIGSGKDLIDSLGKDPKDWLDIGLNAAQLGLDIAGTIPGLGNALTGTLGNIVGMGKVVKGATDLISDINSFQDEFVGF